LGIALYFIWRVASIAITCNLTACAMSRPCTRQNLDSVFPGTRQSIKRKPPLKGFAVYLAALHFKLSTSQ